MIRSLRKKTLSRKRLSLLLARRFPSFFANRLRNPIFIIGCARSGTSLLTRLLSFHADIANWSEANEIWDPEGYPWHTSKLKRPPMVVDPYTFTGLWWQGTEPRQKEIAAIFGAYQWLSGKPYFLNKTPLNTFRIPYLLTMFPTARFIHVVRDGRAVVYSYAHRDHKKIQTWPELYQTLNFEISFEELALQLGTFWKANIEEVAQQDQALSLTEKGILLELTYEDLCADTSATLNRICGYIGVDPTRFTPELKQEQIEPQNYKWQSGFDGALMTQLLATMEPTLAQQGYTQNYETSLVAEKTTSSR